MVVLFPAGGGSMTAVASTMTSSTRHMMGLLAANYRLLAAITRVELAKRYAGSVLGMGWVVLQPALLLSVYLFIYMVVFKVRFPGFSTFDYVLYVFCGLVPYLGFMEGLTSGSLAIKQNIHLVKNVMLPIELVPVRSVLVGMTSQMVSLALVLLLVTFSGALTPHVLWLPIVVVLQVMLLVGLTWVLSSVTVALPDITYFINLFVFLLMFLSPIAFKPEMVPEGFRWVVYLNPVSYMIEAYRDSLLNGTWPDPVEFSVFAGGALALFALGATFFRAFKGVLVDYE
jgi:lipopolysaccharide transport system permease protein